ncbi:arylesterase [Ekhidna sp.]
MFQRINKLFFLVVLISCNTSQESSNNEVAETENENEVVAEEDVNKKIILFYGNSITAGYQLDLDQAFPALIQQKIDSLGFNYKAINAGLSGETSAGGKSRIDWVLQTVPDIFILELGANDGLRGLKLEETAKNLQAIIDSVKKENPEVQIIIAGMMVPPNLGIDYSNEFQQVFSVLADENNAIIIPFLLEGVAGDPDLNLEDGIHPTPEGHTIVAELVWKYLEPIL